MSELEIPGSCAQPAGAARLPFFPPSEKAVVGRSPEQSACDGEPVNMIGSGCEIKGQRVQKHVEASFLIFGVMRT